MITSSPAAVGNRVYVVGGDGHLRAVRLSDGQVEWTFQTGDLLDDEAEKTDPRIWDYYQSSPVIAEGSILFGSGDGHVYGRNAVALRPPAQAWLLSHFADPAALIASAPDGGQSVRVDALRPLLRVEVALKALREDLFKS